MSKPEYDQYIDDLRKKEGITEKDIKEIQEAAIVKKSIEDVKRRSKLLDEQRKSPNRYKNI